MEKTADWLTHCGYSHTSLHTHLETNTNTSKPTGTSRTNWLHWSNKRQLTFLTCDGLLNADFFISTKFTVTSLGLKGIIQNLSLMQPSQNSSKEWVEGHHTEPVPDAAELEQLQRMGGRTLHRTCPGCSRVRIAQGMDGNNKPGSPGM